MAVNRILRFFRNPAVDTAKAEAVDEKAKTELLRMTIVAYSELHTLEKIDYFAL